MAIQSFTGKVTVLEPSYMPGAVSFQMGTGNTTCPAGKWLSWKSADTQNNKAVYATLLAALLAGREVRFHFNDGDTTCKGTLLHLLD